MADILHNPFRELRLRSGLTQMEVAYRAGVSKHAVLRLEQGCYNEPLPSLVHHFLQDFPDYGRVHILDEYHEFQYRTRLANAGCLGSDDLWSLAFDQESPRCPVGTHPLSFLIQVNSLNPTKVAKCLCVSQATIMYFIKSASHQATVPRQIISALEDADYSQRSISLFQNAFSQYRRWLRAKKGLRLIPNQIDKDFDEVRTSHDRDDQSGDVRTANGV